MGALFTPKSNPRLRTTLVVVIALGIACIGGLWVWVRTPFVTGEGWPTDQPVFFDHRHHVQDDGIDCLYCHSTAERSATAGIPSTALCMGCHNQIWPDGITLETVRRSWASGRPIPWNRVHDLPDYVYFNHAIHLDKGVGCVNCHGRVDQMPRVYQAEPMTMGWCLDCHREPEVHLRPREFITDMDWPTENEDPRLAARLADLYDVESQTHCTTCHR